MIKLVVGLRNPGDAYEGTRHNAGAFLIQAWIASSAFRVEKKFKTELSSVSTSSGLCHVALPLTYMNLSGQVVQSLKQFYRILPNEILVVHDELDFPAGCIKLKSGGGHGGHNGLRDIITQIGSPDFHRLRIGIGHPKDRSKVHDYVLSKPSTADRALIADAIQRALNVMPMILDGQINDAMSQLNRG